MHEYGSALPVPCSCSPYDFHVSNCGDIIYKCPEGDCDCYHPNEGYTIDDYTKELSVNNEHI